MAKGLFDLTGKVVLATGANSGIGLGFLQGCAKQGADVVIWGRRAAKNAEAVNTLKALGAPRAYAQEVDVADEAMVIAAFETAVAKMGRIDCVFANAGFTSRAPSFPDLTSEMYHESAEYESSRCFLHHARGRAAHARTRAGRRSGRLDRRMRQPVHLSWYSRNGTLWSRQRSALGHDQGTGGGDGSIWRAREHDRAWLFRQRLHGKRFEGAGGGYHQAVQLRSRRSGEWAISATSRDRLPISRPTRRRSRPETSWSSMAAAWSSKKRKHGAKCGIHRC